MLVTAAAVLASALNFGSWGLTAAIVAAGLLTTLTDVDAFYRGIINKPDPRRRRSTLSNASALRATLATMLASWRSRP